MPGVLVGGMDVHAVRKVALKAIQRARRDEGPILIKRKTCRYRGHSLADPDELRKTEEKDDDSGREGKDPIPKWRAHMLEQMLATEAQKRVDEEAVDAPRWSLCARAIGRPRQGPSLRARVRGSLRLWRMAVAELEHAQCV